MNSVRAITKLNEDELTLGLAGTSKSWHTEYAHSHHVYVGNFPLNLTEDMLASIFEEVGPVASINLVKDKETGVSRGFCFLEYKRQPSTILAVDNFNGVEMYGRTLRVDHVKDYKAAAPTEAAQDQVIPRPVVDVSRVTRELDHHLRDEEAAQMRREQNVMKRLKNRQERQSGEEPNLVVGPNHVSGRSIEKSEHRARKEGRRRVREERAAKRSLRTDKCAQQEGI